MTGIHSNRTGRLGALGLLGSGMCALSSCGTALSPSSESFIIRVDSVQAPASARASDTITAKFYGYVGPTGCWSFDRFDPTRSTDRMDVTVRGRHATGSGFGCTQALVYLRPEPLVLPPPFRAPVFSLVVHQPDGTTRTYGINIQ